MAGLDLRGQELEGLGESHELGQRQVGRAVGDGLAHDRAAEAGLMNSLIAIVVHQEQEVQREKGSYEEQSEGAFGRVTRHDHCHLSRKVPQLPP